MEINSIRFLITIFTILIVYFAMQNTDKQKYVILLGNIYFLFVYSGKKSIAIVIVIVAIVFLCGKKIEAELTKKHKRKAFRWLVVGGALDIGILLYFKYFLFSWKYISKITNLSEIVAPIGLAYFSFTLLGYLLDVYHKKIKVEDNYIDLLIFSLFFPALIQGPFGFYKKLSWQLKIRHEYNWDRMVSGLQRILWGYFKKIVIADRIAILVMGILHDENATGMLIFIAMVFYSFQIYADFSGGIDVIMGISEIMGIELFENFNSPLISKNVTEYWQRWHMSLGEWMEKYLYYPIVLNRNIMRFSKKIKSKHLSRVFSASFAAIVVFLIVGLWHGTGWNYLIYGVYQAFWVSTAVLMRPIYNKISEKLYLSKEDYGWRTFEVIRTFVILVFGRYLIKATSLSNAFVLFKKTFSSLNIDIIFNGTLLKYGLDFRNFYIMIFCIILLIVVDIMHDKGISFRKKLMKTNIVFRYFIYMVGIFAIIIMGIYGKGYNAASFIYAGF